MCGIFGKYSADGVDAETVERMGRVLTHRGPDDVGIYVNGSIGIGNRRLSIIDVEGGRQPIANEDGSVRVVYNGEIYNYRALREELLGRGHKFETSTDTEVIVHLYEEEGVSCVERLDGMFAFALWDAPRKRLLIARDKLGQKPIYYHYRPGLFLFGSEIKALLEANEFAAEPDPESMHHYLSLRFVPPPATMFKDVFKLPAAHTLVLENDKLVVSRYWKLKYSPKQKIGAKEAIEELDRVLGDAVESHLVADVQVGAMLSGGLDSGLITALASVRSGKQISTFSVGVTEDDWSELPYARAVAERYGTDHHEVVVDPNPLEILPELIWHLDEPSDPSAACKYFVSQEASKHVKVVLGGDGGDEMLGGYDRYVGNRYMRYYCMLPKALRTQVSRRLINWVPESFSYKSLASKLRWLDKMSDASEEQRYAASVNFFRFDEETKRRVYSEEFASKVGALDSIDYIAQVFNDAPVDDLVDRMLYTDVHTQLAEHGCMIVDRTTMAFGLESRSPFLDRKLAEFCATLPTNLKVRQHRLRYLERELARKYLPEEVVSRQKQGFGLPLGYWFNGSLGDLTANLFRDSTLVKSGFVTTEGLLSVLNEHRMQGIDHSHRLWILLNLEIWHRIFIEKESLGSVMETVKQPAYS